MDDKTFQPWKQLPELNLHHTCKNIQSHCSGFISKIFPLLNNPNHVSLFRDSLSSIQNLTKSAIESRRNGPAWARITQDSKATTLAVSKIEERLAGVPVYALSNSEEEFVFVSGISTGKSLGLIFFKKEDADALLLQTQSMSPAMRKPGSKVVALDLSKVCQLKYDGMAFRFIPESTQVKNALREREKAGVSANGFAGVPVFQSKSLILRSENKSYRPYFFRKEDLENSLLRASLQQNKLNPAYRQGDIQVAVFEEILKGLKEPATASTSWEDVVFIPPGLDVSTDISQL